MNPRRGPTEGLAGRAVREDGSGGHRLRLTITTSDLPTLVPPQPDVPNLLGGIYSVQRNARSASYLEVLSSPASKLGLPAHR